MGSFEEDKDIIERNLERVTERPIVQFQGAEDGRAFPHLSAF